MFLDLMTSMAANRVRAREQILWHVKQVMGPPSTEDCVVTGDNERAILEHNIDIILSDLIRDADKVNLGCVIDTDDLP